MSIKGVCTANIVLFLAIVPTSARAMDAESVVKAAAKLLDEVAANPKSGITPAHLKEARAILIIPNVGEISFGIGLKRACGVYLQRTENGTWDNPELIHLTTLYVGGRMRTAIADEIVIYRSERVVAKHRQSTIALGMQTTIGGETSERSRFEHEAAFGRPTSDFHSYRRVQGFAFSGTRTFCELTWVSPAIPKKPAPPTLAQSTKNSNGTTPQTDPNVQPVAFSTPVEWPELARLKTTLNKLAGTAPLYRKPAPRPSPLVKGLLSPFSSTPGQLPSAPEVVNSPDQDVKADRRLRLNPHNGESNPEVADTIRRVLEAEEKAAQAQTDRNSQPPKP